MHIISRRALRKAEDDHADLIVPLETWSKVAKAAQWKSLEEVRNTYPRTDPVGKYTVFDIKGNSYRLIVKMEYAKGRIYIKAVQTHAEYDKGAWTT